MFRIAQCLLHAISFCAVSLALTTPGYARIGLVIGEPFGSFGTMMPVGHAAIYLDHVCAASPTQLRPCNPGETGVVLSRYHDLKTRQLDWIAIPAFTFFYGVASPHEVPTFVTPSIENELRESYRQEYLRDVVPDRIDKHGKLRLPQSGDWQEGIGAAFDRRILVYTIASTREQDERIISLFNTAPNHRRYTLGRANCADFAADVLRLVLPQQQPEVLHRNVLADFDMTTPKTLTRRLDTYARTRPSLDLRVYEIPQLPGSLRRSRPLRGSAEMFLKTKRYLATLLVIQPELVLADWILYETKGRWTPGLDATPITPGQWTEEVSALSPDESTSRLMSESEIGESEVERVRSSVDPTLSTPSSLLPTLNLF